MNTRTPRVNRTQLRFAIGIAVVALIVLTPAVAYADGGACATGGGLDFGSLTGALGSLAHLFQSTVVKVGFLLGLIVGFLALIFEGGQALPNVVRFLLIAILIFGAMIGITAWIMSTSLSC